MKQLDFEFYSRKAQLLAPALLGKKLVSTVGGVRVSGRIVETEAYCDAAEPDLACHGDRANGGRPTARTEVMFGPAGYAFVYFTYGMHWMFNVVAGTTGTASAVLIRALEPLEGMDSMARRRPGRGPSEWTNGPAKLAQALAIDKSINGTNLCDADGVIWLEDASSVPATDILTGPRIGLGKTPEPWFSMPWRYWVRDNPFVSR